MKLKPDSAEALVLRGSLKYDLRAYHLAILDLTKATFIDKKCALAYFKRAVCYHDAKEYRKALADYGIVLRLGDQLTLKVWRQGSTTSNAKLTLPKFADFGILSALYCFESSCL